MAEIRIREPNCSSCEANYRHSGLPQKKYGVMLHEFERYCIGSKRARMFKKRDPVIKAPDWCPKRIFPHKVRVFDFKSGDDWFMFEDLCLTLKKELPPEAHRYEVIAQTTTELSAKEFWAQCGLDAGPKLLGVNVPRHGIVEIDDGLLPNYFFLCESGYRYEPYFTPPASTSK
ncbi:hypothetical protein ACRQU7_01380 [Caproiciproducens sp. R1]|uniref:hypothetical protein n=1 Tax=Caproiciproducens sp. R1 TaxID=3435000 RepID=UPI0040336A39